MKRFERYIIRLNSKLTFRSLLSGISVNHKCRNLLLICLQTRSDPTSKNNNEQFSRSRMKGVESNNLTGKCRRLNCSHNILHFSCPFLLASQTISVCCIKHFYVMSPRHHQEGSCVSKFCTLMLDKKFEKKKTPNYLN